MIKSYLKDFENNCILKFEIFKYSDLVEFNYVMSLLNDKLLQLKKKGKLNNYNFVVHNKLNNSRLSSFETENGFSYQCIKYVFLVNRFTKRCSKDLSYFEDVVNLDRVG